jgi:hypothetical protein
VSRRRRGSGRAPAQGGTGRSGGPAQGGAGQSGGPSQGSGWAPGAPAPNRRPPRLSFLAQVGVLVAVFAVVSLIADLAGAANLGVALGIGVIAFAIALVAVIVKN